MIKSGNVALPPRSLLGFRECATSPVVELKVYLIYFYAIILKCSVREMF